MTSNSNRDDNYLDMRLNPPESSVTIKWAVVIGIIVLILGGLFGGYSSNANRLTKLESSFEYLSKNMSDMKESQTRSEVLLSEIRFDQKRRQMKELDK